jgi:formyltetrahydrofolate deformylase
MNEAAARYILTLSCPDRTGIVKAVAGFLTDSGCNILDSAQYGDPFTGRFFMRVHFEPGSAAQTKDALKQSFAPIGETFAMEWQVYDERIRPRVVILVSKFDHCLRDLLYRVQTGELKMEVAAVVSNHRDAYKLAASYDVPFYHWPVTAQTKAQAEAKLRTLVEEEAVDLVVLARYMQILSPELSAFLAGRVINIHHSFLPSFKGAKPYHQAHARGVKLIGATAHFVTDALDEGPIIEQDVERVHHAMTPDDMVAVGRDVERLALARAVRLFIERRVLLNGHKTVVFR